MSDTGERRRSTAITADQLAAALAQNNENLIKAIQTATHNCVNQEVIRELTNIQATQANKISALEDEAGKVHHALFDNGDQGLITRFALEVQRVDNFIKNFGESAGGATWLKRTVIQVLISFSMAYAFWLALSHGPAK